jgi:hypothetical protein
MPRQDWAFRHDVPVMEITFELPDGSGAVTRVLEVDTGASGAPPSALRKATATCCRLAGGVPC